MATTKIVEKFSHLSKAVGLEDFTDRLNFRFSATLLLLFCSVCTFKTYAQSPIECYMGSVPLVSGVNIYAKAYCWVHGTYAVNIEEFKIDVTNPNWINPYRDRKISYYQWVPFLLWVQAVLFYAPRAIWSVLSHFCAGEDVSRLIQSANEAALSDGEERIALVENLNRMLEAMMGHMYSSGFQQRSKAKETRPPIEIIGQKNRLGLYLLLLYFVVKVCYLGNSIGQLFLIEKFLNLPAPIFKVGRGLMQDWWRGQHNWTLESVFPMVTVCPIELRSGSSYNVYYAQCTLPINMVNEKIFIFLGFWICGVAFLNFVSILVWILRVVYLGRRAKFISQFLYTSRNEIADKKDVNNFVHSFLRQDGVFLLRMLALNSGEVVCKEVVCSLWRSYRRKQRGRPQPLVEETGSTS